MSDDGDDYSKEDVEKALSLVLRAHNDFLMHDPKGVALDMSGADLRHATFDNANLSHASFKNANFNLAKMGGARMERIKRNTGRQREV